MFFAADRAQSNQEIISEFGTDMKKWAPKLYYNVLWATSYQYFQSGQRLRGLQNALLAVLNRPLAWQVYPLVAAGMAGPGVIRTLRMNKKVRDLSRKIISRGKS